MMESLGWVVFFLSFKKKEKRSCSAERDEASLYKSCYLNLAPGDGVLRYRSLKQQGPQTEKQNRKGTCEKERGNKRGNAKENILKLTK
jgi:hypothetical protein